MIPHRFISAVLALSFTILSFAHAGFTENKGQFHPDVSYKADVGQFRVYLDKAGFTILLHDEKVWGEIAEEFHHYHHIRNDSQHSEPKVLGFQAIKYKFKNADWSQPVGVKPQKARYNYFLGNDQSKWAGNVRRFERVLFSDVYPNIDIEFVVLDTRFKYNFILKPGAEIEDIKFTIDGAEATVDQKRIRIDTRFGPMDEVMPISFWASQDGKEPAEVWYIEKDGYIQLRKVKTKKNSSLVIDPELIFATYSGSSLDNFGFTATYDDQGNLYSGGIALAPGEDPRSRGSYPVTAGAFDETFNGGQEDGVFGNSSPCDIAISKYSSDGSELIYATYLGGSSNEFPHSLIVDENNNLIIYGTTYSSNYPTTPSAFQRQINLTGISGGVSDIIITKLNADGSALVGSTYYGGSSDDGLNTDYLVTRDFYADEFRGEVNLDADNQIYIASCTYSEDLVTTFNTFQRTLSGGMEGLIFSMNEDLSGLRWSSYFGGTGTDALYSVDFTRDGEYVVVSGGTNSLDFAQTENVHQPSFSGYTDGVIALISNDGRTLEKVTYVGGASYDQVMGLHVSRDNQIYVVGNTSSNITNTPGYYGNENSGQFIAKYTPDLSSQEFITTFGSGSGTPDITINAFLVDECGKIFVSGWGGNSDADQYGITSSRRLRDMPLTSNAVNSTTDGQDFYITVFTENMASLDYASYIGGTRTNDHVDGGTSRFDERGIIYQSVCASCPTRFGQNYISDFPTTEGAYAETNSSYRCSNASFKYAAVNLNEPPVAPNQDFITNVADTITVQLFDTFEFNHTIRDLEGDSIFARFEFPDALKDEVIDLQTTYEGLDSVIASFRIFFTCKNALDTFRIKVIAWDNGCPTIETDSSFITIKVNPPDPLPPPDVFCLYFQDDGALRLEWKETPRDTAFYRMMLYKQFPDGRTEVIKTQFDQAAGRFIDNDVIDPRNNDYSYHLRVENYCGSIGDSTILLSTVKESQIPVTPTRLKTVTVNNKLIEVHYLKSVEPDFDHYEIYRAIRGDTANFVYYTSIFGLNDTVFTDTNVDVANYSYCYQVRVADDCGRVSPFTPIGCSIVIRGEAINKKEETPRFKMDLEWDKYIEWDEGVNRYVLLRSVDTGVLRPIVENSNKYLFHRDENLDFDWGGYWYSVLAYEEGGLNATSRSNDIYLIQPPLVFVPNAVTANGDELNDVFGWSDAFVKEFEMRIYNRWGEKVYETTDKNIEWDGEYKEKEGQFNNVYFWIVTYKGWDNSRHTANGTVTLLK